MYSKRPNAVSVTPQRPGIYSYSMLTTFSKGVFGAVILFLAGLSTLIIPGSSSEEYLYDGDINATPVIEYVKPDKLKSESDKHPNFLASKDNGPRFVEFYAPWCPHCQHFKSKYIAIARKLTNVASSVKFYAIACTVHSAICDEYHISGYPTIKYFSAGNNNGELIPTKKHNLNGMKNYVASEIDSNAADADTGLNRTIQTHVVKKDIKIIHASIKTHQTIQTNAVAKAHLYNDATVSFMFALRNSIFMTLKALSSSELDAFETWLRLLYETLPHTMGQTKDTIVMLLDNIGEVAQSEKKMLDVLSSGGIDLDITSKGWTTTCAHDIDTSGYTCGLWELFHVMTIGLVEKNHENSKAISTMHAAESLSKYVEHFFACEECRHNFLKVYDDCSFDRCNRLNWNNTTSGQMHWKQLPLWLWEVHNDVNTRLMRENNIRLGLPQPTFDEQQIVVWPSRTDCEKCWNADGTWVEDEVYLYLHQYYWPVGSEMTQTLTHAAQNDTATFLTWRRSNLIAIFTMPLFTLWLTVRKRKWRMDVSGHHKKADDMVV